jgi:hypothetical protein
MFAFADRRRVFEVLTEAGWRTPRLDKLDLDLDIAAGRVGHGSVQCRRNQQLGPDLPVCP